MTEADRETRLLELAQRVCGDIEGLHIDHEPKFHSVAVRDEEGEPLLLIENQPRCLDMLEAALLVAAAQDPIRTEVPDDDSPLRTHLVQYAALVKVRADMAGKQLLVVDLAAALAQRALERQKAWVEKLAADWRREARERDESPTEYSEPILRRCADELEQRAKGNP